MTADAVDAPLRTATWWRKPRQAIEHLPSHGYRRAAALVNRQRAAAGGRPANHERVHRVMREHRLPRRRHGGRPADTRAHDGRIAVDRSDTRWCSDGFEVGCDSGERVRVAFALDCCDREAMSWVATTAGISGDMVRDWMIGIPSSRRWLCHA